VIGGNEVGKRQIAMIVLLTFLFSIIDFPVLAAETEDLVGGSENNLFNSFIDSSQTTGQALMQITQNCLGSGKSGQIKEFFTLGDAILQEDQIISLVQAETNRSGAIYSIGAVDVTQGINLEFDFYMGEGTTNGTNQGNGADGIAVAFASEGSYTLSNVEEMGFCGSNAIGVEFDTWNNSQDPEGDHVGIIQDSVRNHLATGNCGELDDGRWHHAKIVYEGQLIGVYVDDQLVTNYDGVRAMNEAYVRITASTGSYTNKHLIKNVNLNGNVIKINLIQPNVEGKVTWNGHDYQIFDERMSWKAAKAYCENLGGHLLTITSQEEQDFINVFMRQLGGKNYYYLGATDEEIEGEWKWVTGEPFEYINEPSYFDNSGNEDFLQIYNFRPGVANRRLGQWNDMKEDDPLYDHGIICEWGVDELPSGPSVELPDVAAFNVDIYRAIKLQNETRPEVQSMKNDLYEMETPSDLFVKALQESGFDVASLGWEALSAIFSALDNISSLGEIPIEQKDMYSALILSALEVSVSVDYAEDCQAVIRDSKKITSNVKQWMEAKYAIEWGSFDLSGLSGKQKKEVANYMKEQMAEYVDPDIASMSKVFSNFDTILDGVNDVETYVEKISTTLALAQLSNSMKNVITAMNEKCPADNWALKEALADCAEVVSANEDEVLQIIIRNGCIAIGMKALKFLVDEVWWSGVRDRLLLSHPSVAVLVAAYKTSSYLTNAAFSTDQTVEHYQKMCAIRKIIDVATAAQEKLRGDFNTTVSDARAQAYLSNVDFCYAALDQDCVEAYNFVDVLDNSAANKVTEFFGQDNYSGTKEAIQTYQKSYAVTHESLLTSWIYDLELDYPNSGLYEQYEHLSEDSLQRIQEKEWVAACPVDVYVYDEADQLVASIVDGKPYSNGTVLAAVNGEKKILRFFDGADYRLKYVGSANGTMDVTVKEYGGESQVVRTANFYDLGLTAGTAYETTAAAAPLSGAVYQLQTAGGQIVTADYDSYLAEQTEQKRYKVTVVNGGILQADGLTFETEVNADTLLEINAYVKEGDSFIGWEADDDRVVFEDATSRATNVRIPDADVVLTAVIRNAAGDIAASSVQLDKTQLQMKSGEKAQLKAAILPTNATDQTILWSSSDGAIASVGANGMVTAVTTESAEAIITAATTNGRKATCTVTVNKTSGLKGDVNEDGSITAADMQRIYAHMNGSNLLEEKKLSIADVNGDGLITAADMQRIYAHMNGSNPF